MLCGDVPWEGSSRRSVSLQGSLSRGSSTCVPRGKAQPSCWRETGVSLVARFPTRPPCDSLLYSPEALADGNPAAPAAVGQGRKVWC